jgi:predicted phage terminase large subunit-like protein
MARTQKISPEVAQAELAWRELARRRLQPFGEYVYPWWQPAPVHELICAELEQVYRFIETGGEEGTGSLIIEIPPQHGKTTVVSRIFPSWLLGKRPDSRVILTAYVADLAQDNSRAVRQIVEGEKFEAIFGEKSRVVEPVELDRESSAKENWSLAEPHRGGITAVGVGGGATGKPAELIVVDDPFKNREQAESPQERKRVLKWFTSSILSRARKGTAIVIIHTRWHREDLIGEMLKSMQTDPKARQFKVLSLPALPLDIEDYSLDEDQQKRGLLEGLFKPTSDPLGRTPGCPQPLWEAEFPMRMLEQIRATLEASGQLTDWYALYQQQPRPAEGVFFGEKDFVIVDRAPEGLRWVRYVDLALSEKKTADWNATAAEAIDADGIVYLRDMLRVKGWNEFRKQLKSLMLSPLEQGVVWGIEDVAFQALAFGELILDPDLVGVAIKQVKPKGDKVERARPLQTRASVGKVRLVRGPWIQAFILEMLDFPNGQHDDQVDTASGGLQMIAGRKSGLAVVEDPFARW